MMAVNVTANWHLIRHMHPLLLRSDAGRVVFLTSGAALKPARLSRPLRGQQGARSRRWRAPTPTRPPTTPIRVNLFAPGPTRTRMRAAVAPGEDPMTLPTAEAVAETIVPLCLPDFQRDRKDLRLPGRAAQLVPRHRASSRRNSAAAVRTRCGSRRRIPARPGRRSCGATGLAQRARPA